MRNETSGLDYYTESGIHVLQTVLLCIFRALYNDSGVSTHARKSTERLRPFVKFYIRGRAVCRAMFFFCYCLTEKKFKRLMKIYKEIGVAEVRHGGRCKRSYKVTPFEESEKAFKFIQNYADNHALFLPGRQSTQYRICKLLPTNESKKSVYELYCANTETPLSYWLFRRLWRECCNDVIISRPKSDLCVLCSKFYTSNSELLGKSEEEKLKWIE